MKYDVFVGKIWKETLSTPGLPSSETANLPMFDGISRKKWHNINLYVLQYQRWPQAVQINFHSKSGCSVLFMSFYVAHYSVHLVTSVIIK